MVSATALHKIYEEEARKRVNEKGLSQYVDLYQSSKKQIDVDPWIENGTPVLQPVANGGHVKVIIFGAGFGGICAAYRCIERGAAKVDEILIVDPAGGFGGTWWWNRFPGLMCDIESYIYLPLLEITGYMPKRKYSGGEEIRHYADLLADKFSLRERAMFQTSGKDLTWSATNGVWTCNLQLNPKGLPSQDFSVTADYVILASGGFTGPKLPALPGLDKFQGETLHTARWDYSITGGSSARPELTKLAGKKVALVGTGATAVQAVPHVAKYAGELYVFQRTASAVDIRNNRDTDPAEWESKIANKKGWQNERAENFQAFTENVEHTPDEDLVYDGWTQMPTISAAWGGNLAYKPEDLERFAGEMQQQDAERSERVRKRVADTVKDQATAQRLQAWYPGWCKRPCFHDEYLPAFNQPNVHLVDTDAKGIEDLTATGIVANGKEFPVDIIIWSTGYGSPLTDSLAGKAGITVIGKDGIDMDKLFKAGDLATLHGVIAHNFPNLFSLGLAQAGVGVNQTQRLDAQSEHAAYIIHEAEQRTGGTKKVAIEPSEDACNQWGDRVASWAYLLSNMGGCLPSYFNGEGDFGRVSQEAQTKSMRNVIYGQGLSEWLKIAAEWRTRDDLDGLELSTVEPITNSKK